MHVAEELRNAVEEGFRSLGRLTDDESAVRPAPGKWSPKEVIGHLIDSATNNHGRFVRAQLQEELIFPGYAQDDWVTVQRYQGASWPSLLSLWRELNLHIARIMEGAPLDELNRPRRRHNLHHLAWQTVPESEVTTLEYFMRDYVGHLRHHLGQIGMVERAVRLNS